TVAASFQTPTLFLIAQDLTRMQVDASVSESDVGPVLVGQRAEFTVDAFPRQTFAATVSQVRQAPVTVQNVVTYDVVLSVPNPELMLKPGMTANAKIITAEREDALQVPLQALRFSPVPADHGRDLTQHPGGDHKASLWVPDGNRLRQVPVERGIDDGASVEIVSGNLKPGDRVITDETTADDKAPATRPAMGFHHF